ncbi:MAG: DUF5343 domain-containing protein [Dehalococcoidia bacterium]|nr:DUF5343 domain-containing protein [Dehalococcoidia bacterium]
MAQNGKSAKPPYVSFRTFLNFLEWLHDIVVIPDRLDRSFWGERLSGATGPQLIGALRFLGLIDDNNRPQRKLQDMAKKTDERKAIIREQLLKCYAGAVQGLDLQKATPGQLEEGFRTYSISGETLRKAQAFFIHATEYCGITLSPHITKKTRTAKRTNEAKKRTRPARRRLPEEELPPDKTTQDMRLEHDLHPSLRVLLAELLQIGSNWTEGQQERWLNIWGENVKYFHPTKPPKEGQLELKWL